nr:hypothetical protein [Tanacetum cinerariifolium]
MTLTFAETHNKIAYLSKSDASKGFSGVETPLFEGMIVEQQVDEGADEVHD